jgi:hypothetical protein
MMTLMTLDPTVTIHPTGITPPHLPRTLPILMMKLVPGVNLRDVPAGSSVPPLSKKRSKRTRLDVPRSVKRPKRRQLVPRPFQRRRRMLPPKL